MSQTVDVCHGHFDRLCTYVDKQFEMTQSVGVCVNILIDLVQVFYIYIGRQTV